MNIESKDTDDTNNVQQYYTANHEKENIRLIQKGKHELEFLRTQDILKRHLPPSPIVILDIGGGSGIHAFPLAKQGHEVHLIDLTPALVEQAKKNGMKDTPLASYSVGDARKVDFPDENCPTIAISMGYSTRRICLFKTFFNCSEGRKFSSNKAEATRLTSPRKPSSKCCFSF